MKLGDIQRLEFESQFRKHFRDDFQSWFGELAKRLHPIGDCQATRVGQGDSALDLLVINIGRVYQCFAPDRIDEEKDAQTAAKVKSDFEAASEYLARGLREWVFVHNYPSQRIGKKTAKALTELKANHPNVTIFLWGKDELWTELNDKLTASTLRELFGASLEQEDVLDLRLSDIEAVIARLSEAEMVLSIEPLEQPDPAKLEFNDLSSTVQANLAAGRYREPLVKKHFSRTPSDVAVGERIAEAFRGEYAALRKQGLVPNVIFDRLLDFTGWKGKPDAKHQASVLAVMSYFFHRCDIFENPEGDHDTTD